MSTALGGTAYQVWAPRKSFLGVPGGLAQGRCMSCLLGWSMLFCTERFHQQVRAWFGPGVVGAVGAEVGAAAVLLLPSILMGMTFSHLAQETCGQKGGLGRALSVNTIGAAFAPYLFGVVLLPHHAKIFIQISDDFLLTRCSNRRLFLRSYERANCVFQGVVPKLLQYCDCHV